MLQLTYLRPCVSDFTRGDCRIIRVATTSKRKHAVRTATVESACHAVFHGGILSARPGVPRKNVVMAAQACPTAAAEAFTEDLQFDDSALQPYRDGMRPVVSAKLGEYIRDMALDSLLSNGKLVGDLFVRIPGRDQPQHIDLP